MGGWTAMLKLVNLSDDECLEGGPSFHTLNPLPHRDEQGTGGRGEAVSRTEPQG